MFIDTEWVATGTVIERVDSELTSHTVHISELNGNTSELNV